MSTISTGTGLISGIDIEGLVTKLIDIEKQPVTALQTRIDTTNAKKTAYSQLTAQLLKLKMDAQSMFGDSSVFTSRAVQSSNENVMTATADSGAALGTYSFTVKSLVQSHQMISGAYSGLDSTIGAGTITIESGNGNVDRGTFLDTLNGGKGVAGGLVQITDRAGRSAQVDLAGATTVQEVLDAINSTVGIGVRASVAGDHIVLTDTTGKTASDLMVEEVGEGSTASDLGILGDSATATLAGGDVVAIGAGTMLDSLNDGRGVDTVTGIPDFTITRKDGTSFSINVGAAQTIDDVLKAINSNAANADGMLVAAISADGKGITLTDSTGAGGSLAVAAENGSTAAADLGILGSTTGAAIEGKRVVGGLNTVLLATLSGGAGIAAGSIQITNHAGATATVDLSSAATLADVMTAINSSGLSVTASYNSSHTGITLTDASTGSGALSVAEAGSTTAADLKLVGSTTGATIGGANLEFQYVSNRTTLDSLNAGKGVYKGTFRITDRAGMSAVVDLTGANSVRIEDVLSNINSRGIGVHASLNATGDGILLTDTSGGSGTLKVQNVSGTTGSDLHLTGSATAGDPTHIDGSMETAITIGATDTIQMVADKINASGAAVTAKVVSTGSTTNPYRLSIVSKAAGVAGRMIIDTGSLNLKLSTTQSAQDAVVLYGQQVAGSQGMLIRSQTNSITGIVDGLTLNLKSVSEEPVTVSVTSDDDSIAQSVSTFVSDWNAAMDAIQTNTSYDTGTQKAGVLFADSTIMQIESQLHGLITYAVPGLAGSVSRLNGMGASVLETGKLSFDPSKLQAALGTDRDSVEKLFSTATTGLGAHFSTVLDNITNETTGTIKYKGDNFDSQIKIFQGQIDTLNKRIDSEQTRLYNEFYQMEVILSQLQTQKSAVDNIPSANIWNTDNKNS